MSRIMVLDSELRCLGGKVEFASKPLADAENHDR